jgi:hypothetical protein
MKYKGTAPSKITLGGSGGEREGRNVVGIFRGTIAKSRRSREQTKEKIKET